MTLTYSEKEGPFGFADSAPTASKPEGMEAPQVSAGDQLSIGEFLLGSDGKTVGQINAACTVTIPAKGGDFATSQAQCTGTATVPDGSIALSAGGEVLGERTTGAIVGGTGAYTGATGTWVDVHDEATGEMTVTFNIGLPG